MMVLSKGKDGRYYNCQVSSEWDPEREEVQMIKVSMGLANPQPVERGPLTEERKMQERIQLLEAQVDHLKSQLVRLHKENDVLYRRNEILGDAIKDLGKRITELVAIPTP